MHYKNEELQELALKHGRIGDTVTTWDHCVVRFRLFQNVLPCI